MWDKDTIFEKVATSADKYGYSNPQQWKQLVFAIKKSEEQQVYEALVKFFTTENANNPIRQELAGRLLYELKPQANIQIEAVIKLSLENYDLSVEHYLFYFVERLGIEEVKRTIATINRKKLSETEINSLETMEFWLKNYDGWAKQNNG